MRYRYYQTDWEQMVKLGKMPGFRGYETGDPLILVYKGSVYFKSGYDRCAELLYRIHNDDARPRNQEIRSMCAGDVIVFEDEGNVIALTCDTGGWKRIEPPQEAETQKDGEVA